MSAEAISTRDRADAIYYAKTIERLRRAVAVVTDNIEDEGDRVYFGSSNHADALKDLFHEMDGIFWDRVRHSAEQTPDLYANIKRLVAEKVDLVKELDRHRETVAIMGKTMAYRRERIVDLLGGVGASQAARDVIAERQRQVEAEGWTPEHDDKHDEGQMAEAAVCYLAHGLALPLWPWDWDWFKPKDRRSDLVRAAALIVAEIERMDGATTRVGDAS